MSKRRHAQLTAASAGGGPDNQDDPNKEKPAAKRPKMSQLQQQDKEKEKEKEKKETKSQSSSAGGEAMSKKQRKRQRNEEKKRLREHAEELQRQQTARRKEEKKRKKQLRHKKDDSPQEDTEGAAKHTNSNSSPSSPTADDSDSDSSDSEGEVSSLNILGMSSSSSQQQSAVAREIGGPTIKDKNQKKGNNKSAEGGGEFKDAREKGATGAAALTVANSDAFPLPEGFGPGDRAGIELKLSQLPKQKQGKLQPRDVQELILSVFGQAPATRWMLVRNRPLVQQVVVVALDGLCSYNKNDGLDSVLVDLPKDLFVRAPVRISYSRYAMHSVLDDFCLYPRKTANSSSASGQQQQQQQQEKQQGDDGFTKVKLKKKKKGPPLPLADDYMLSPAELEANEFPSAQSHPDFTELRTLMRPAKRAKANHPGDNMLEASLKHLVGVDCEMCRTERGLELARVSAVDSTGKVLLDTLVKPPRPIVDYLTQFSGITAEKLQGVQTTIKDVHQKLGELLDESTILVGHSLENDLKALEIRYDRVIDTSLLYPHRRGPEYKTGLKHLTAKYLKSNIQNAGQAGHDSIEDAQSAVLLAALKIRNGPDFGLVESEFEDFMDVVGRHTKQVHLVADPGVLRKAGSWSHRVACSSDAEVFRKSKPLLATTNFAVIHLGADLLCSVDRMIEAAPSASRNSNSSTRNLSTAGCAQVWNQDSAGFAAAAADSSSDDDSNDNAPPAPKQHQESTGSAAAAPAVGQRDAAASSSERQSEMAQRAKQSVEEFRDSLACTRSQLRELYNSLRPNTLFVLFGCRGHSQQMQELLARKQARKENPALGSWSLAEEELLNELSNDSQVGVVFFSVKDGTVVDQDQLQAEQRQQAQEKKQKQHRPVQAAAHMQTQLAIPVPPYPPQFPQYSQPSPLAAPPQYVMSPQYVLQQQQQYALQQQFALQQQQQVHQPYQVPLHFHQMVAAPPVVPQHQHRPWVQVQPPVVVGGPTQAMIAQQQQMLSQGKKKKHPQQMQVPKQFPGRQF